MSYSRLSFEQYFIDNSEDYHATGKARRKIRYKAIGYRCSSLAGLFHYMHEVNYEIFYDAQRNVIQLNFQKTNGKSDWFANIAEFADRYYDSIDFEGQKLQLRVHHGWGEMYKTIKYEVREAWLSLHELHPEAETEIIGWSLGSGQAMLCAQDLNYNFGLKPYLYTYGSVRPFRYTRANKALTQRYLSRLCKDCRNFAVNNDIVTYMPPFFGFTMPKRVELVRDKRTLRRLLNPNYYHTIYDESALYDHLICAAPAGEER